MKPLLAVMLFLAAASARAGEQKITSSVIFDTPLLLVSESKTAEKSGTATTTFAHQSWATGITGKEANYQEDNEDPSSIGTVRFGIRLQVNDLSIKDNVAAISGEIQITDVATADLAEAVRRSETPIFLKNKELVRKTTPFAGEFPVSKPFLIRYNWRDIDYEAQIVSREYVEPVAPARSK